MYVDRTHTHNKDDRDNDVCYQLGKIFASGY